MDGKAVSDIEDGKSELSVGYSSMLKWEQGVTPDTQEHYDAIQTAIRVNHIAIVDAARGGRKLKFGDGTGSASDDDDPADPAANGQQSKEDHMTDNARPALTTVVVDSIPLTMDAQSATIVSKTLKEMTDKLTASAAQIAQLTTDGVKLKTDSEAAIAKLSTDHKTALDAANAQIETLKKQVTEAEVTPEKLDEMVEARDTVRAKAKAVLGDKLVTDKKKLGEIMRQVVDAKMGETAKSWSDDQVRISFDTLTAGIKLDAASGVQDVQRSFQAPHQQSGQWGDAERNKAYADHNKKLENRWKTPGKAA
jgi:uncharacterized protein